MELINVTVGECNLGLEKAGPTGGHWKKALSQLQVVCISRDTPNFVSVMSEQMFVQWSYNLLKQELYVLGSFITCIVSYIYRLRRLAWFS